MMIVMMMICLIPMSTTMAKADARMIPVRRIPRPIDQNTIFACRKFGNLFQFRGLKRGGGGYRWPISCYLLDVYNGVAILGNQAILCCLSVGVVLWFAHSCQFRVSVKKCLRYCHLKWNNLILDDEMWTRKGVPYLVKDGNLRLDQQK